jgi:subtilisin family serine protease
MLLQRRALFSAAGSAAILFVWGAMAPAAQAMLAADDGRPQTAKGRVLVRFRETVLQPADAIHPAHSSFQAATADRSNSLDLLHIKHRVRAIRPLFAQWAATRPGDTAAVRRERFADRLRAIQTRYGRRAARAARVDAAPPSLTDVYVVDVPEEADVEAICRDYAADDHVAYCQPDYLQRADMAPNDPAYGQLWGLATMELPAAWDVTQGRGIVVGVVDSGVEYDHPDLALNIWRNTGEIADNGVDDDQNGYIDDVRGWDFAYGDKDPRDLYGHGTHVAGTIAAVGNNSLGVIGVAPEALILPAKGLGDTGSGFSSQLAQAIVYAAVNGADVINNSWGCASTCPSNPVAEDAVRTATGLGAVVVFSAGNNGGDVGERSPARMDEVIAVAATTPADEAAPFSNFGTRLDLSAPGTGILSTWTQGRYQTMDGTSMAAPHVSGLAALVLARDASLTPQMVHEHLRATADDLGASGFDPATGYGRVNAARALSAAPPALTAAIDAPAPGAVLRQIDGSAAISGTASGPDFLQYQLSYGAGAAPAQWTPIGSAGMAPVTGGLLGTWAIASLADGAYSLRLVVTGADGRTAEHRVPVTLQAPVNQPPVLAPIGAQTVVVSAKLTFTISASDPEGGALTYGASGLPAGASFDPVSRTFAWVPTAAQAGTYAVIFSVRDAGGLTDAETVSITVTGGSAGANLLANPGFEEGKTAWSNWSPNKTVTSIGAFAGGYAARIEAGPRDERWVNHDVVLLPGSPSYVLEGAVKTALSSGQAQLRVQWKGPRGRVWAVQVLPAGGGVAAWRTVRSGVLTPPAKATKATVSIGVSAGQGEAHFDSVSLAPAP